MSRRVVPPEGTLRAVHMEQTLAGMGLELRPRSVSIRMNSKGLQNLAHAAIIVPSSGWVLSISLGSAITLPSVFRSIRFLHLPACMLRPSNG